MFSCSKGTVDLERPIGILPEGGEVLFSQSWTQQQQDLARQLQPMALAQWWQQNHPNWDLLEWDSEVFKADGQLVPCKLVRPRRRRFPRAPGSGNTRLRRHNLCFAAWRLRPVWLGGMIARAHAARDL